MVKAVIYSRVSSSEQETENQTLVLIDWAKQRCFDITSVYQEEQSAWKVGHQKELARLLSDCRNGKKKIDIVLVWALDRMLREGATVILNLINTFKAYSVRVISYQKN